MSMIKRMRLFIYLMIGVALSGMAFLMCIPFLHYDKMQSYQEIYLDNALYQSVKISDRYGEYLYDGGYSDDEWTRLATFHVLGDTYGSVPGAVLNDIESDETLTIDLSWQKGAYQLLKQSGLNGTILAADFRTGEIYCIVSTPSVDVLNNTEVEEGAYLNKATSCFPPGSTFKTATIACLLEAGIASGTYNCTGREGDVSCLTAHGSVNLKQALYESCNCGISYFGKTYLTPSQWEKDIARFHLLDNTVIAGCEIASGFVDASEDWMWAMDGQGKDLISPAALACFYGAIANDGIYHPLTLNMGQTLEEDEIMSLGSARWIQEALREGMHVWYGDALDGWGKTGTAEVGDGTDHAWFVCCLDDPEIVIVTMLAGGGSSQRALDITTEFVNCYIREVE